MAKFSSFDAADYLDDEETIAHYITAALEDPNPDVFLSAVGDFARARGMAQLAKEPGLGVRVFTRRLPQAPSLGTTRCSSYLELELPLLTGHFDRSGPLVCHALAPGVSR